MATISKFTSFNASDVRFSEVKKNKMGGKAISLSGANGGKLVYQLPLLKAPYGLSDFTDKASGKVSYSLDLSLDDNDVLAKLTAFDERVLDFVASNCTACLGKEYKRDVIKEALHKPLVKQSKGGYAPTLKLKVATNPDGSFEPAAYTMEQALTSVDKIGKGTMVHTIVEFNSIWFIDNKFGVSVRLQQVLFAPTTKLTGFAFSGVETTASKPRSAGDSEEEVDVPEDEEEVEEDEE
jgi:Family of unknown function (DUF5871)